MWRRGIDALNEHRNWTWFCAFLENQSSAPYRTALYQPYPQEPDWETPKSSQSRLGLDSCEIVAIINTRNVDLTAMSAEHLKECSPSEWWKEIKRLCRVTNSSGGRNNVRKAVRHLEGDRDISPTDFSNHVNWAFLTATEGFFRSPTFPAIQNTLVCLR